MKTLNLLAIACLSAVAAAPAAAATWSGTADYGVETVGPFNTYDFSSAGVLLTQPISATQANSYYQSFVTQHLLDAGLVSSSLLNSGYEITVTADFSATRTVNGSGESLAITGGSFALWLDKTPDHNFSTDTGFTDGVKIMEGSVLSGSGAVAYSGGSQQFGGGALQLAVTSYDHSVFTPNTIAAGDAIFTLRLNSPADQGFLGDISSVQGHAVDGLSLKYAADGNLVLAVPEPGQYAMLLAGLGVIGAITRRRRRS